MQNWLFILVNICVAGFVGGITNHFAIKMLFHPREEKRIFGRKVPFTPGLIPKRKEEIADSLGHVVSDYLVTSDGLQELIRKPKFRQKMEAGLRDKLEDWSRSERTIEELALRVWSEDDWKGVKVKIEHSARRLTSQTASMIWNQYGLDHKPVKEFIPGWSEEKVLNWSSKATDIVLKELADGLMSAEGQRMLTKMASSMMDKAGGFFGTMAAIFVDEDKMVQKMTPMLIQQLEGDKIRATVTKVIAGKLEEYGDMPLHDLIESMSREPGLDWVQRILEERIPWSQWLHQLTDLRLSEILAPRMPAIEAALPRYLDQGLRLLERTIPATLQAVNLPELVQEQVSKFPVERLEQVILSVSGREFRAITWLGVLLGGMIGLFQSLLTMFMR
ncbi:DUF445 family protein [Paenibacillus sp. JCM 10914]|nr:hypothetical protein SAV1846 [Paenibacillus sp. JCM 10914]